MSGMAHMRTLAEAKTGIERFPVHRLLLPGSWHRLAPQGGLLPGVATVWDGLVAMVVGNGMGIEARCQWGYWLTAHHKHRKTSSPRAGKLHCRVTVLRS